MQKKHNRLGSGIDALLGALEDSGLSSETGTQQIDIHLLVTNENQPRQYFNTEKLAELANSIRQQGVLQPIIVESFGNQYRIVAGERRFRASRLAGLKEVPVIIRSFSDEERVVVALLENIQRENISPLEEATAYKELMNLASLSQQELADRLGKNRSTIANTLRLLNLPAKMQDALNKGIITAGHARALLAIENSVDQEKAFKDICENKTSVRSLEERAQNFSEKKSETSVENPYLKTAQDIGNILDMPVKIKAKGKGGILEIKFENNRDLKLILSSLGIDT